MKIGFTGTRVGMTPIQFAIVLRGIAEMRPKEVHHGACIGADKQFHDIAFSQMVLAVIHPGVNKQGKCFTRAECFYPKKVLPERFYLDRDKDIVDAVDFMIATPKSKVEELRSGTWATIRYAKKKKKDLLIVYPDGNFKEYRRGVEYET